MESNIRRKQGDTVDIILIIAYTGNAQNEPYTMNDG